MFLFEVGTIYVEGIWQNCRSLHTRGRNYGCL